MLSNTFSMSIETVICFLSYNLWRIKLIDILNAQTLKVFYELELTHLKFYLDYYWKSFHKFQINFF